MNHNKLIVVLAAIVTAACSDGQTHHATLPSVGSGATAMSCSECGTLATPILSSTVTGSCGSDCLITSTGAGSIAYTAIPNLNCVDSMGRIYACSSGPSYETRKNDSKGPTLLQVKNSAKRFTVDELPPVGYVNIARSAGIDPGSPVLDEARVMNMIDGLGLKVYSFDKVDNYLYRKALSQGTNMRWVWKPVRSKDLNDSFKQNDKATLPNVGMLYAKMYSRQVPVSVLKLMKEMECEMSDVMFMISDYEVVKPDPFLAVTTKSLLESGKIYIIFQWDEPGFKDGPELQASR